MFIELAILLYSSTGVEVTMAHIPLSGSRRFTRYSGRLLLQWLGDLFASSIQRRFHQRYGEKYLPFDRNVILGSGQTPVAPGRVD